MRAKFCAEIHRSHCFLQCIKTNSRIVGCESAILKHRIVEEVGGRHRHFHPGVVQRLLKIADDSITFCRRGIDRDQIVVVQVYAVSTQLTESIDDRYRTERRSSRITKWIATAIADGPKSEREFVFRFWFIVSRHVFPPVT